MDTLLHLIFKDKQEDKYNVLFALEDIKHMLWNQRFCLDNVDSWLARMESFLVSYSSSSDLIDLPSEPTNHLVDSAQDLTIISFDQD